MTRLAAPLLLLVATAAAALAGGVAAPGGVAADDELLARIVEQESIESAPQASRLDYLDVLWRRLWRRGESVLVAWGEELTTVSFVLIALLLAGAVAWIFARLSSLRWRPRRRISDDATTVETRPEPPDYLAQARQARRDGDLALCWRLRWRAIREALGAAGGERPVEHLTNLEFVARIRAARPGWPALEPLERLARSSDRWFYGGEEIDRSGLERAEALADEVLG